ncbi:flagellar protein FlaG [Noviherbaspirillum pedocola]|uniref:Flagellar protein FlaG n=1 Tax=Noviherbaspirillum pedocola TaxID=2801341 RepID=A0A934SSQ4_9BURK|nr:flagellar protein FlaG [Noviherbaspirillum pedocola]MBK4735900.1 flagellar protein FlaG [Noviherbaspirillum pedocola]
MSIPGLPANPTTASVGAASASGDAQARHRAADTAQGSGLPASSTTPDAHAVEQAVNKLNAAMAERSSNITFSIDEASGKTLVKVIDSQSKDVLMQIPSQEALAIDRQIDRFQGLLVKTQA